MIPRLYIKATLAPGGPASLSTEQANYLRNVLRRKEGDAIRLFNAVDGEFSATIAALGKKGAAAAIAEIRRTPTKEPDLHLLFAPIKRTTIDALAQKATALGVSALRPVISERTNAARVNIDRLGLIAIEAAEQSERLSVPTISKPEKLRAILDGWEPGRILIFCDEAGDDDAAEWGGRHGRAEPMLAALGLLARRNQDVAKAAILVGPEGGFTSQERAQIRSRDFVTPVTLGPRTLRADTAAMAAVTLWQAACGDFRDR